MTAPTRRIALVGCGKAKAPQATEARWLYTGPLFRAALNAAEAEFGDDVWILSAKHGLVDLDEVLEPYDVALDDCDATYLVDWGRDVIRNLHDDDRNTPAHLSVYAGHAYAEALRPHLRTGWTLEEPMAGLGQGERLAWLKRRLAHASRRHDAATPLTTLPAGPSGAAEPAMSNRLTDEQRLQQFQKALELEHALVELEALRERFLAAWDTQHSQFSQQCARAHNAASLGVDPTAPEQQALPLDPPAPKKRQTSRERKPAEDAKEASTSTEPKKRGRPPKKRDTSEVKGEKRVEPSESGRTVAEAQSPAVPAEDNLVPPPAVPCCTCGGSLSDHDGSSGRCRATHGGVKCRCKAFQLHKVWDWVLTWGEESGLRVFWLNRQGAADAAAHGPLRVERGTIVRHVLPVDVLAAARTGGVWPEESKDGVPLRVLEVVERVLSSQLPPEAPGGTPSAPSESRASADAQGTEPKRKGKNRTSTTPRPIAAGDSPESEPAPASSSTDSQLGDWSVELPERHEGGSIIRLWLVNSTTSERVPCTWWSSTSTLKPGHRLSGRPEGEALSEELRVKAWWTQHQDSVVAHVAESCRQGKVPGLCLYLSDEVETVYSRYALSGGWWMEAQEVLGDEKGPWFRFFGPTGRSDMREVTGYFRLQDGKILSCDRDTPCPVDVVHCIAEAESFIARGFVFEAMP